MHRITAVALTLILCCTALTHAEEPTTDQVIAAARAAAMEAHDRDAMLQLAEIVMATDTTQALRDLQEAARMPGLARNAQVDGSATVRLADLLAKLGDKEAAAGVLRSELQSLLAAPVSGQDWEIANLVARLSRLAGAICPTDEAMARTAFKKVEDELLPRVQDSYQRQTAVAELAAAKARLAPDEATMLFARECPNRLMPASLLLSVIETNADAAMIHLAAIASGQIASDGEHNAREVQFALVGAVMRQDMNRALLLARQLGIASSPSSEPVLTRHIADALVEVGIDALPDDPTLTSFLRGAATGLARVDPAMALELTSRVESPNWHAGIYADVAAIAAEQAPDIACEAARRALAACESLDTDPSNFIGPAAAAIAPVDSALAAELLRKMGQFAYFEPAFGSLLRHDRAAADALLADLPPEQQLLALASMMTQTEDLDEAGRSEIAERALQSPAMSAGGAAACRIVTEMAELDLDRARQAWQSLDPIDVTTADKRTVADRLTALAAVAEAYEARERGSSTPEVSAIRDAVLAAPPRQYWAPLFMARLAGIYANYDGPAAKAAAEQVLADLADSGGWRTSEARVAAIAALSRVDMRSTKVLITDRNDLNRPEQLQPIITEIARRRPAFACQMVYDVSRPGAIDVMLSRALQVVGAEEDEATAIELINTWMAARGFRPSSFGFLFTGALDSGRASLIDLMPACLDTVDDPGVVASIIELTARPSVGFATDTLLDYLLQRLAEAEPRHTQRAIIPLSAAVAERRWEDGLAMVQELPVNDRPTALLLALEMREHRREVLAARRAEPAAEGA